MMKGLAIRVINVVLIAGCVLGYNQVVENRAQKEEVARLNAELAAEQLKSTTQKKEDADSEPQEEEGLYTDGTYEGSAEGFGGEIDVEVTVEDGKITDITVVSAEQEDKAYLQTAEDIIPAIVDAQSADVDTISGATFSSTGIRDAVEQALEGAVR